MIKYKITNENVQYYSSAIAVPVGAVKEDIIDALGNAEMDVSIHWDDGWAPSSWEALYYVYDSPDTSKVGETTLVGYLDLIRFQKEAEVELEYHDAWGFKQDKIPICHRVIVDEPDED
ncbi:MAG: hypothetical protein LBC73_09510 [Oscillospiraceae bacterium]|jgi:hypothetical protein|nr:hypothetical protein [Oscillospiraceae bacterium]